MTDFKTIKNSLLTQDNRITEIPIFVVEQKVRIYGLHGAYTDHYVWIDEDTSEEPNEETISYLDENHKWEDDIEYQNRVYSKAYYTEKWEFVTACFTEKGAQDFINAQAHNLNETRIYVYSGYRNAEWQFIRKMLMEQ